MEDVIALITALFSGDIITIILKLVLGLVSGIGAFFAYRWIDKARKKAAHDKTMKDRAKEQADLDQENRDISDDAKQSEKDIEEIIKKRKNKE